MRNFNFFLATMLAAMAASPLASSVRAEDDDGGYISEANDRKPEDMEAARAAIPAVKPQLPVDRLKRLPRTMARLQDGGTLRVVMLGDSIINDTARSCWHELVEKRYPKCDITRIAAVRGGTGCWFYREPGKIEKYVLAQKPDLLMIGGISHKGDIEAIRDCIQQVRNAGCKAEIFLMTGPYGASDPFSGDDWRQKVTDANTPEYAEKLRALADELQVEFLDLQLVWGECLRAADKPLGFYKRDPVHANAEGEAVLARILEQYFTVPE